MLRLLLIGLLSWFQVEAAEPDTSFGFTGPESYPIENGIAHLRSADLDGDGLEDLVIANNARSKISLLFNQTGKTNAAPPQAKGTRRELNELPPDARFRLESIASEKRIAALVVADLNGDKRPDLAYYGEPKELVVQYNQGKKGWGLPKRWLLDDGQLTPNALTVGDLNGDGRADLLLLGESALYAFFQGPDQALREPEKIPYSGNVKSVQVLDIDGNERDDLLLVNWDSPNPFRFRLQTESGRLGSEIHFALPPIRSYWSDDLDRDHRTEIITIAQNSGRAQIFNFLRKAAPSLVGDFKAGQFEVLPLQKTSKSRRGVTWADVNGDQLPDLLVSEPDEGQLTISLQQTNGSLAEAHTFPSFTGVTELAVAGEGRQKDIYLLSPEERQVGITRFDAQGRVPFPKPIPLEGRPLAMTVGILKTGDKPALAVIVDDDGRRSLVVRHAEGRMTTQKLSEGFKSNPTEMALQDADHDGLADLVVLIPYEKIKILRQRPEKEFEEIDVAPPGGTAEQPWLSAADVDGDGKLELLLAQRNFIRAVVLSSQAKTTDTAGWAFQVKDQINGAASNSRIVGATPLRNGSNAVASLFLLDADRKAVTLCERDTNGVWQVVRNILLPFSDFKNIMPVAIGSSKPNSIALLGPNAVGWIVLAGDAWELNELDGYETPIKDGHLHDVVSGDLNQDKRKDLVFLETGKNHLDLVIYTPERRLVPVNRWQVFEERTFRSRRGDQQEPREALVVDVSKDGRNDLVVVVHDRILVYPQE